MSDFYFDEKAADKAVNFIEKYLTHTKGELAKTPFILQDYQKEQIIRPLFGWKNKNGKRKYRTSFIFLPRKNGKSTLAAAIVLTVLYLDNEYGKEIYSAANDKEQAKLVFECARMMIENNPKLSNFVEVFKNSIVYNAQGSYYKAISRDTSTKHGFSASCFVYDELHGMKDDGTENLWQVLETSTGARSEPLAIAITTAGFDKYSACYKMYSYACDVRDGIIKDDQFLPVIFEAEEDDDITDPETWKKANPGLGVSLKEEYMERECKKAQSQPSYENIFRRLHLNQWTTSQTRWINDIDIVECDDTISEEILLQNPCYGGLDLASVRDLTALVLIWRIGEKIIAKHWTFIPEEKYQGRTGGKDKINYMEWADHLEVTPGNVTDYNFVKAKIFELCEKYQVQSIAFDRWNSSQLVIECIEEGVKMSAFGMGYKSLSPAAKEVEAKIMTRDFVYFSDPVLRWQFSNVELETDAAGNIKPNKKHSSDKIDTIMALCMAVGEELFTEAPVVSKYKRDNLGFFTV
jgi:phage terminase large subunit-like protein